VGVNTIATFETPVSHLNWDWGEMDQLVLDLVLKAAVPEIHLIASSETNRKLNAPAAELAKDVPTFEQGSAETDVYKTQELNEWAESVVLCHCPRLGCLAERMRAALLCHSYLQLTDHII
jgi:hypothetical protein